MGDSPRLTDDEKTRLERLTRMYRGDAVARARRLGAGDEAEDAVNDALIAVVRRCAEADRATVLGYVKIAVKRARRVRGRGPATVANLSAVERAAERKTCHGQVLNEPGASPGGRRKMLRLPATDQDRVVALVADAVALFDAFLPLARAFVDWVDDDKARGRPDNSAAEQRLDDEWAAQLPALRRILGPDWRLYGGEEIAPDDPKLADWRALRKRDPAVAIGREPSGRLRLFVRLLPDRLSPWPTGVDHPLNVMIAPPEFLGAFDGLRRRAGGGWTRGGGRPRDGAPLVAAYVAAVALEMLNATGGALEAARKHLVQPTTALIVEMGVRGAVQAGRPRRASGVRREVMRDGTQPVPSPYETIVTSPNLSCEGCETPCAGPGPKCRGRIVGFVSQVIMPQGRRDRSGRAAVATVRPTPVARLLATMPDTFRRTLDALIRAKLQP